METKNEQEEGIKFHETDITTLERGIILVNNIGIRRRVLGCLQKTNNEPIMLTEDPQHFHVQSWTQQQFTEHAKENNWKVEEEIITV